MCYEQAKYLQMLDQVYEPSHSSRYRCYGVPMGSRTAVAEKSG